MGKKLILVSLLVLLSVFAINSVFADDIYEGTLQINSLLSNEAVPVIKQQPRVDAGSAIVMDMKSGRVLYEKNAYTKRAMASTTKVMTAIIAIENGKLNDMVTVSKRAASIWGSTISLKAGDKYTLRELLYGLMLSSGNDAAIAIAEHLGGSVDGFAEMMNNKAKELGAKNTSFRSPHGLDMAEHYSTAYDLAIITRYALNNPVFSEIVKTRTASIHNISLYNTNELLGVYPGTDGVKTGYTGQAGRCLVASATRNNWRIISVVLNSPTRTKRAQSSISILDYAFNNYKPYTLLKLGENVCEIPVIKGRAGKVPVQAVEEINLPLTSEELDSIETQVDLPEKMNAPVGAGIEIGSIKYLVGGKVVGQSALKTAVEVNKKNAFDYLKELFIRWGDLSRAKLSFN